VRGGAGLAMGQPSLKNVLLGLRITRTHVPGGTGILLTIYTHTKPLTTPTPSSAQATPPPSPSASATPAADDAAAAQRRLASVVRQLTRGEVVRFFMCDESEALSSPFLSIFSRHETPLLTAPSTHLALSLCPQEIVRSSTARDGSFTPGIGPDEIVAAVAEQKRISLDPALFAPPAQSITRQGRHEVPLRILSGRSGGSTEERVVLRVAVGAAAAGPASTEGGGDDEERKKGGKK